MAGLWVRMLKKQENEMLDIREAGAKEKHVRQ
jgi:hypothetical protein